MLNQILLEKLRGWLPKGWDNVAESLAPKLDLFEKDGGTIRQVKEKFGSLRIYGHGIDLPDFDEEHLLAKNTCMECGKPAAGLQLTGWFGPRCKEHLNKGK